jgi:hypothetical protein
VLCFPSILHDNIATVLNEENDKATDGLDSKLDELQNELLRLANSKADYNNVADEIYRLRRQNGRQLRVFSLTDGLFCYCFKIVIEFLSNKIKLSFSIFASSLDNDVR